MEWHQVRFINYLTSKLVKGSTSKNLTFIDSMNTFLLQASIMLSHLVYSGDQRNKVLFLMEHISIAVLFTLCMPELLLAMCGIQWPFPQNIKSSIYCSVYLQEAKILILFLGLEVSTKKTLGFWSCCYQIPSLHQSLIPTKFWCLALCWLPDTEGILEDSLKRLFLFYH
jgi:hypothetical protein